MSNAAPRTQADLIQLFEPVREDLEAVEREFARQVQSQVHVIPEIGNYLLKSGGKRVRPAVLLMSARLCGYTGPRAVLNAAVVEFIHTATLVHDDIIDDADVRRGRKAVHSQWGNDVTVLAGDFLYIKSMAMALTQDTLDIVRLLCDVTLRMIEGELYQLTKNGVVDLSEDEHFEIIRRKTAYLFGGCAQIGGMLGEVGAEKEQALREYGFSLGIMFQLVDDLLDFTGAAEALGKPIGGDLREGKITLPIIHLLEHGGPEAGDLIRNAVRDRDITAENWARLKALLAEHRSIEYAYGRAVEFGEAAKRQLRLFAPSQEREALMGLADYVLLTRPVSQRTVTERLSRRSVMDPAPASRRAPPGNPPARRAVLRPGRARDQRRRIRRADERAQGARSRSIPSCSRPIRRRSASAAARPRALPPSSTCSRCSASTTPTTKRSCAPSTSACARAWRSSSRPRTSPS